MIETMMRVKIVGLKDDMLNIIRKTRESKSLHLITPRETSQRLRDENLNQIRSNLRDIETRISVILSNLPPPSGQLKDYYQTDYSNRPDELFKEGESVLKTLEPVLMNLQMEIRKLEDYNRQIKKYKDILVDIQPLWREFHKIPQVESIVVILDKRTGMSYLNFEKKVGEITQGVFQLVRRNLDENYTAILALFDTEYLSDIQKFLYTERVSEMKLPPEFQGLPVKHVSEKIQDTQIRNDLKISKMIKDRTELSEKYYNKLVILNGLIITVLEELEIVCKMANFTEFSFEIEGFVPKSRLNYFKKDLKEEFGERITIFSKIEKFNAPVLRRNPSLIKPFETLTNLIGLPIYGSIDPTPLIFIMFPFFWGFMVGDIGYGMIILILSLSFPRIFSKYFQNKAMRDIAQIFTISSIWTIFFGILYAEFFGNIGEEYFHWHPIWINRYEPDQLLEFLLVSVLVGYFIILLGLILGMINNLKLKQSHHARADGVLFCIWAVILISIVSIMIFPEYTLEILLGTVIFTLAMIIILIILDKIAGIIHVIERFSNILSFARLMAIGLVGAEMAFVANKLVDEFARIIGEPMGLLIGILFALLLHLINIMILILSPSIHALRLNVYEFFSQFSKSGGELYLPYGN